ncbi:MAG TPA: DUF2203 domain-containing protein [Methylomirabilota bacterium]|nr:DUF2203 domain-containing protein [Methylomirabilota bacterium]
MSERYWAPAEVERLIPRLTKIMDRVRPAHVEAGQARERLQAEQQRITMSGGGVVDQAAWRATRERLDRGTRVVRAGLEEIQGLGGVTKDVGLGLVDFLHLRDGREVNLCWRYGEERITHWHGLDEGYAARKPL